MSSPPTRRALLTGAASLTASLAAARFAPAVAEEAGLHAAAARTGLAYGSAVASGRFDAAAPYRAALARECGILVCENAMKMGVVLAREEAPSYGIADATLAFARANRQRMRGHCLVWHEGLPNWAQARLAERDRRGAEALLRAWIGGIAGRYRGAIEAWDVVNEIVAPEQGRPDSLRDTPWLAALGPRYVDLAFAILHEADPAAAGVWNDTDIEQGAPWMEERRSAVLRGLESLRKRGVPIRRFGLQSHLYSTIPLDERRLRGFLREIAGMGLAIEITEMDVDDRAFPADIAARDRGVADLARRYLDVVLDEAAVLNVLTWDLYAPDTWLNASPIRRRPDGLPQRALPLDPDYRRTPLWHAMRAAFAGAPDHAAARARLRGR